MKVVIAIPHSHTWFWTQTCLAALQRYPVDAEIVVVDNSPWSPAARGIDAMELDIPILANYKHNQFHASALDCIVETYNFDYFLAMETDVLVCREGWLQWFLDQMQPTDYAVGHWHHEQFINPSCTLYRGSVLRDMLDWCKNRPEPDMLRWGPSFQNLQPIAAKQPERDYRDWFDDNIEWIAGPFADKRGWPAGTALREAPSGQLKGPGWYEPGQMLHHWAVDAGYTYTICPTLTTQRADSLPLQTLYGASMSDPGRQLSAEELFGNCYAAHLWGGTRALDIVKHAVTCQFVASNTPFWLEREARYWKAVVPEAVQQQTLELIRRHGWHITGQGRDHVTDRDREAAAFIRECYKLGGVEW